MKIKRNKIDDIFSKVVRLANNYVCECCGKISPPPFDNGMIDTAHNVGRRVKILRYDPRNVSCLCRSCHLRQTEDPHQHVYFFKHLNGENYQFCREMKNSMQKITKADEESIYKHYKKEYAHIQEIRASGNLLKLKINIPEALL